MVKNVFLMSIHPKPCFLFDTSIQENKIPLSYVLHEVLGHYLLVLFSSKVIIRTHFFSQGPEIQKSIQRFLKEHSLQAENKPQEGKALLEKFFGRGQGTFALNGTAFKQRVYQALSKVKRGESVSYQQLAINAGYPGAERAVGSAMAQNPLPYFLPCHRILPAKGGWGQYRYGQELKKNLLQAEGVTICF